MQINKYGFILVYGMHMYALHHVLAKLQRPKDPQDSPFDAPRSDFRTPWLEAAKVKRKNVSKCSTVSVQYNGEI